MTRMVCELGTQLSTMVRAQFGLVTTADAATTAEVCQEASGWLTTGPQMCVRIAEHLTLTLSQSFCMNFLHLLDEQLFHTA